MTSYAQNSLENHRTKYYTVSRDSYAKIMKCYENSRQTNEEADKCAEGHRDKMVTLEKLLQKQMMDKCKNLEKCTDNCKSQEDMPCINKCGTQYMQDAHVAYDTILNKYMK